MESDSLQQTRTLLKLLERTTFVGIWTLDLAQDRLEWSDQLESTAAPRLAMLVE